MSKIDDQTVPAALSRHLQPGEQLRHWAYGVKQPHIGLILLFYATIGGALAVAFMTKHYVIGLTDRRLLVISLKPGFFTRCHLDSVVEVFDFPLHELPRMKVTSSSGMLFSHFKIEAPNRTWVAKFHRMGMSRNHEHCAAIANVLGNPNAALQMGGAPPAQLGAPPPAYGQPPYGGQPAYAPTPARAGVSSSGAAAVWAASAARLRRATAGVRAAGRVRLAPAAAARTGRSWSAAAGRAAGPCSAVPRQPGRRSRRVRALTEAVARLSRSPDAPNASRRSRPHLTYTCISRFAPVLPPCQSQRAWVCTRWSPMVLPQAQ